MTSSLIITMKQKDRRERELVTMKQKDRRERTSGVWLGRTHYRVYIIDDVKTARRE